MPNQPMVSPVPIPSWRLIQKVWKQAEPSGAEVRLWKDMRSQGTNHDRSTCKCLQGGQATVDKGLSVASQRSRGQGRGPGVHFFSTFYPMKYVKSFLGSALLDLKIK